MHRYDKFSCIGTMIMIIIKPKNKYVYHQYIVIKISTIIT